MSQDQISLLAPLAPVSSPKGFLDHDYAQSAIGRLPLKGSHVYGDFIPVAQNPHWFASVSNATPPAPVAADPVRVAFEEIPVIEQMLAQGQAAVLTGASVEITPGPRAIGNVIEFFAFWSTSEFPRPQHMGEVSSYPGSFRRTFGSQISPPAPIEVPMPAYISPVLKSARVQAYPRFYLFMRATPVANGPSVNTGEYLNIQVKLDYNVYGGHISLLHVL